MNILNYIDGNLVPAEQGHTISNFNPSTGEQSGTIPASNNIDVENAYHSAKLAFQHWKNISHEERFIILNRIAELIDSNREPLARAESEDQGKPLWLARNEIIRAAQNMRFFATAALQFSSESHHQLGKYVNYTLRIPLGVVGCISPWNLPLYLFTWKIAPALAAGNCVIAKPSEFTPLTAYLFSQICMEAKLPSGVLNIVHGTGMEVGEAIVSHPGIKAISFTGSTAVGKRIASIASPMFKKISLELGGKNPTLVFKGTNIENTAKSVARSAFLNQGEICLCGSRIYVETTIYHEFKDALVNEILKLQVGDPFDEKTKIGALVSKIHYDKVISYLKLAETEGGIFLTGKIPENQRELKGWYISPTLIENIGQECRTNKEEIFGPIATIQPFNNLEEAVAMANDSDYGLSASIWTTDINQALMLAEKLEAGIIWINSWLLRDLRTPFGGTKNSGIGREGGWEAMKFFTETKNVCIAY